MKDTQKSITKTKPGAPSHASRMQSVPQDSIKLLTTHISSLKQESSSTENGSQAGTGTSGGARGGVVGGLRRGGTRARGGSTDTAGDQGSRGRGHGGGGRGTLAALGDGLGDQRTSDGVRTVRHGDGTRLEMGR
jgi:hypothetical protein